MRRSDLTCASEGAYTVLLFPPLNLSGFDGVEIPCKSEAAAVACALAAEYNCPNLGRIEVCGPRGWINWWLPRTEDTHD